MLFGTPTILYQNISRQQSLQWALKPIKSDGHLYYVRQEVAFPWDYYIHLILSSEALNMDFQVGCNCYPLSFSQYSIGISRVVVLLLASVIIQRR